MARRAQYKAFEIRKHGKTMWRVNFPKGDHKPDRPSRKDFATEKEANRYVRDFLGKRNRLGELASALSPEEAADAVKALRILPKGITLEDAATFTAQRMNAAEASCTFQDGYTHFLTWLTKNHRSKRHIRDLKQTQRIFQPLWQKLLPDITRHDVEGILSTLQFWSRNLKIRHLATFFTYCIDNEWLAESPMQRIREAKPKEKDRPIKIFSIKDVQKFLYTAAKELPETLPYFAISFFAGTRPDEISKLTWEEIGDDEIMIPASVNKTRTERYTTINPTLKAWLAWHHANGGATTGRIYPRSTKTLERRRRELALAAGISWIQDGPRKMFASAHYRTNQDESLTVRELGHTGNAMLHRHYNRNMKPDEATAYWAILPPQD